MTKAFDDAFSFYLSYHSDITNQWIHIICVWPILFTAQILLAYTPSFNEYLPATALAHVPAWLAINLNVLFAAKYAIHYAFIEQPGIAGIIGSVLVMAGYLFSVYIVDLYPESWKYALGIHIFCWAAQIFGHKVYEKRQPAFMDNMQQALVTAPLFVLMEVLCDYCGYKAEFKKKMKKIADENIKQYKKSLESKKK